MGHLITLSEYHAKRTRIEGVGQLRGNYRLWLNQLVLYSREGFINKLGKSTRDLNSSINTV